jgi:hypothetical protein
MITGMNDGTPTGQRQGTGRTPTVTVGEAAAVLGISPDAVRGRLQRGTLPGEKIAGAWHVHLSTDGSSTGDQRVIDGPPAGHQQDALVAHLEGEVTYLRERLEEADRQRGYLQQQLEHERERADVLQALGTGTTPDTAQEAPGSPQSDDRGPTGIRAWRRRLLGRDET